MAAFEPSTGFATAASGTPSSTGSQAPAARQPLEVPPTFCPVDVDSPFDTTEWELRTAAIKGEDGDANGLHSPILARLLRYVSFRPMARWTVILQTPCTAAGSAAPAARPPRRTHLQKASTP